MKVLKLNELDDSYSLVKEICDYCNDDILTDNIKINHVFTHKSIISPGQKIELDICENCFLQKFLNF
jgi:hypothetical protein